MEYKRLTNDQQEYLRQLNDVRAKLASVAYNLQQQVANLTSDLIEYATPRELVWNAIEGKEPKNALSIQWCLKDARERLERQAERLDNIRSIAQKRHNEIRRALRDLDPEPARDAAEEIYCERNED